MSKCQSDFYNLLEVTPMPCFSDSFSTSTFRRFFFVEDQSLYTQWLLKRLDFASYLKTFNFSFSDDLSYYASNTAYCAIFPFFFTHCSLDLSNFYEPTRVSVSRKLLLNVFSINLQLTHMRLDNSVLSAINVSLSEDYRLNILKNVILQIPYNVNISAIFKFLYFSSDILLLLSQKEKRALMDYLIRSIFSQSIYGFWRDKIHFIINHLDKLNTFFPNITPSEEAQTYILAFCSSLLRKRSNINEVIATVERALTFVTIDASEVESRLSRLVLRKLAK